MTMPLPTKPQSYGEIFSTAYRIATNTFSQTLPLFILLFAITFSIQLAGAWTEHSNKMNELGMSVISLLLQIILLFLSYAVFGGIVYRMHSLVKRNDPGFAESFFVGSKKVIPFVLVAILYTLAVLLGLVLLIIPGIMVTIYLIFGIYLLYQDFGIIDSLKESYRLVKDNWWRTAINITLLTLGIFFVAVAGAVLIVLLSMGIQLILGDAVKLADLLLYKGVVGILFAILLLFIYNYGIAFMLACIYDLQVRKSLKV